MNIISKLKSLEGFQEMTLITKVFFFLHILLRLADAFTHLTNPYSIGARNAFEPYSPTNMSGVSPSVHVSWESGTQMLILCLILWPLALKQKSLVKKVLWTMVIFIASFWFNDLRARFTMDAGQAIQIMTIVNPIFLVLGIWALISQYMKDKKQNSVQVSS